MTVHEFSQLPKDPGAYYSELRAGKLVRVKRPFLRQTIIEYNLLHLFEPIVEPDSIIATRFTFRPLPEYEVRVADIVCVSWPRVRDADPDDYFVGVPEVVIKVRSQTDAEDEIDQYERLCLDNGGQEFWLIDPELRRVTITNS